jgi:hypothetical protein
MNAPFAYNPQSERVPLTQNENGLFKFLYLNFYLFTYLFSFIYLFLIFITKILGKMKIVGVYP